MSAGTIRRMRGTTMRQRRLSSSTRESRQRPLPTEHGHAARPQATRGYQSDSSSQRPRSSIHRGFGATRLPRRPPEVLDSRSLRISFAAPQAQRTPPSISASLLPSSFRMLTILASDRRWSGTDPLREAKTHRTPDLNNVTQLRVMLRDHDAAFLKGRVVRRFFHGHRRNDRMGDILRTQSPRLRRYPTRPPPARSGGLPRSRLMPRCAPRSIDAITPSADPAPASHLAIPHRSNRKA